MKKKLLLFFMTYLLQLNLTAQYISKDNIQPASEIWSEPAPLDTIFAQYLRYEDAPALTKGLDTIYYFRSAGICRSYKIDGKWTIPELIFADGTIRDISLSKDGKRIYFSGWGGYGSWDIWHMDWDPDSSKWKTPWNMGPEINSDYSDNYIYEINKDTIYVINRNHTGNIYYWNGETSKWIKSDELYNEDYQHPLAYWGDIYGLSVTEDRKKLYFAHRFLPDFEKDIFPGTELFVTYKDTLTKKWGDIYYLNINSFGEIIDTVNSIFIGSLDNYPWISPDGKTLIFSTSRGNKTNSQAREDHIDMPDIYISYLLVDENGDTVTSLVADYKPLNGFYLKQNYPNPFNPETTVAYRLDEEKYIKITLYDSIGRLVKRMDEGRKAAGEYKIKLNASGLATGVYYCVLSCGLRASTIKMIYLK